MTHKDLREKKELQKKLKGTASIIFDEEKLPEISKDIDELLEELDKQLAENKKIIEKNTKEILATIPYEDFLRLAKLA